MMQLLKFNIMLVIMMEMLMLLMMKMIMMKVMMTMQLMMIMMEMMNDKDGDRGDEIRMIVVKMTMVNVFKSSSRYG